MVFFFFLRRVGLETLSEDSKSNLSTKHSILSIIVICITNVNKNKHYIKTN